LTLTQAATRHERPDSSALVLGPLPGPFFGARHEPVSLQTAAMIFEAVPFRRGGKLLPRHLMWHNLVVGELIVAERHDAELGRTVREATIVAPSGAVLLGPLLDAALVSARRGCWSMTGWERYCDDRLGAELACQQSWMLTPKEESESMRPLSPAT
jgi:hypothetical protein